jgi:small subunit ribosomal protein S8
MTTDPIADMLTRIRNAIRIVEPSVDVPGSKFKKAIADILVSEGYLKSADIGLKYGPRRTPIIKSIRRVSTPGRRNYAKSEAVPVVRGGLGLAIISTSQGLMADRDARRKNIGGEVICEVW